MKKILIILIFCLIFTSTVYALNIEMTKLSENEVMIAGVKEPAVFLFNIENKGGETSIEFFNLLGFSLTPASKINFDLLEEKQVELRLAPIGEFNHIGPYTLTYFVRDTNNSQLQKTLTFNRIELVDAIEIGAKSFNPDSNSIKVFIKNNENIDLKGVKARFYSTFFDKTERFDLDKYSVSNFTIELNPEDFDELIAGFYTMNVEVSVDDALAELSTSLEFTEQEKITTEENDVGILINTHKVKKTNEGNVATNAEVTMTKNIISRLFTTFSPEPSVSIREGFTVYYAWSKSLSPGESLEVTVNTNWYFPIILIILIIAIVLLTKQYVKTNLVLRKKVNFVRAKGGEFALKISIYAHAKKYIENINIVDRLPPLVKVFEKFGTNKPVRVDEKSRRIDWTFEKLEPGEIRVMSYIIYSKVGVMGKFSLSRAKGIFERDGQIHETSSNRAFFVSEPRGKDIEEE